MFETLINNVKANIDSKVFENNEVSIKGWSFHESNGVCPVRCRYDGFVRSMNIETRPDITQKFNRNNIILCGWKFVVPMNKYIDLQIKIDNDWLTFISFNTLKVQNTPQISTIEEKKEVRQPNIDKNTSVINFSRNPNNISSVYIIDNFYKEPNDIRNTAIQSLNLPELNNVTKNIPAFKAHFEKIIGVKLDNFQKYPDNGKFQYSIAGNKIEFSTNSQHFNAIIFLTPDAPINTGITFYKSRYTNKTIINENEKDIVFQNGNMDSTEFVPIDVISNIYNRLLIFNPKYIHAISNHFGKDIQTGRLVQTFAFDMDPEEFLQIQNMEKTDTETFNEIIRK